MYFHQRYLLWYHFPSPPLVLWHPPSHHSTSIQVRDLEEPQVAKQEQHPLAVPPGPGSGISMFPRQIFSQLSGKLTATPRWIFKWWRTGFPFISGDFSRLNQSFQHNERYNFQASEVGKLLSLYMGMLKLETDIYLGHHPITEDVRSSFSSTYRGKIILRLRSFACDLLGLEDPALDDHISSMFP